MKRSTAIKSMKKNRRGAKKNPARKKPQLMPENSELFIAITVEVCIIMLRIASTAQKLAMKDSYQEIHHMTGMKKEAERRKVAEAKRRNIKKEDTPAHQAHQALQVHLKGKMVTRDTGTSTGNTKKGVILQTNQERKEGQPTTE